VKTYRKRAAFIDSKARKHRNFKGKAPLLLEIFAKQPPLVCKNCARASLFSRLKIFAKRLKRPKGRLKSPKSLLKNQFERSKQ